jgi:magnesium chelatase family protein
VISRANRHVRYPARFQLVGAMNPCKCGGGAAEASCRKKPRCLQDYQGRLSGPFLDRIDLFCDTPPVTAADLALPPPSEGTTDVAARVAAARDIQKTRFSATDTTTRRVNADLSSSQMDEFCQTDEAGRALLTQAATQFSLSARAYHRVLKVARTIADLDQSRHIRRIHLAEALTYRWRSPVEGLPARLSC